MRKRSFLGLFVMALAGMLTIGSVLTSSLVMAQSSSSENYQMVESQFGNASSGESCSEEYCARVSIGEEGRSSEASSPEFGEADYSEPLLEMIVEPGESSLGQLSTERTGTKIMKVKIRNYLSGGYMLQIIGDPPKYEGHMLKATGEVIEPRPGTEQFAINAVVNTVPQNIGENPKLQPSGEDGTSLIQPGYNAPNAYKYVNGDTIAVSQQNSGGADFTITMMVNISNATPAGLYSGDFAAVILPYY